MKILHYTQHVLGIGHLFRSLAIDAALAPHEVHLVTGGPEVELDLPTNVRHHSMPALKMDAQFQEVQTVDQEADLEATWQDRERILLQLFENLKPDVIMIEMFPFGRKRFARELLPVLEANRTRQRPATTLCSVRDILVEKEDQDEFERKVLKWLNPNFDGVLVHSDPNLIRLDQTFARIGEISCPIWYTGYVAQGSALPDKLAAREALDLPPDEPILLASAGSGTVGADLLLATLKASILLHDKIEHQLIMFTGPHAGEQLQRELAAIDQNQQHIHVSEFTGRFPDYVLACDLSISMAGYNTTMNLLACGAHGMLYPFDQNREQRMRLTALHQAGYFTILEPGDLDPLRLAELFARGLREPQKGKFPLQLAGDTESARIINQLIDK
jgi:predicted glycosyltransferase